MKKVFLSVILLAVSELLAAQDNLHNPKPEYGFNFLYHFDNREFDYPNGKYMKSWTIFSVVGTPSVGFSIEQGENTFHRVNLGIDIRRDMGDDAGVLDSFGEMLLHYDIHTTFANGGRLEGVVGVFPREYMEGEYSEVFFTDSLLFYDRNLDGAILKYMTPRFYTEIGADWMGKFGQTRKERFHIFTAGDWIASKWMKLGWAATLYHYAGSVIAPGVVDNHTMQLYVELDGAKYLGIQECSVKLSPLIAYQRDRIRDDKPIIPLGGEMVFTARHWNIWFQNTTYVGDNLMPYYYRNDSGGAQYGPNLYMGSPFYRSFYNLCELYWEPRLTNYLRFRLSTRFHFDSGGFMGSQQKMSLLLNLDACRNPHRASGRIGMDPKNGVFRSSYML